MKRTEKKDGPYEIYEATDRKVDVRILKNTNHTFFSVYAKRYAEGGYIELSSSKGRNLKQAKSIAEKLVDVCLGYNPPEPGKEY